MSETGLPAEQTHFHYVIYKPYRYLSQFVPETRKSKPLLGELFDFPDKTMAIGRLDHDSEGLLLLTTDGMQSHLIRSKTIEKEYYVQVDGEVSEAQLSLLRQGVEIGISGGKYLTLPCKVEQLAPEPNLPERGRKVRDARHGPTSWLSVTIGEGKNRQVRKMTAAVGLPTLRLVRVRIGNIRLKQMKPGEVIPISNFAI
ncbi:pseudouridine synthase [Shewanella schlegeliana]|uniref:Pseudouridine synthase n=1 Tax=Shewanella schlegeliana TaxID=190308 RepID=A0ABS1SV99_9GAMM|nr:pseudouridine synthase [Shewanella schlegeliana]MBL4912449.1 pseudouridine synthase [Shewanella schlegeliana]MCL1108081.1 pseudouridine synthase [Shewanella schlegeliana]GIU21710.1 pseudouridine synthase [Shewanella schlegeliana]